ncbi:FYTTD1 isoform 5 [Pan troglodytes]|uniref:UAP56-interacting factor n=2 Tax=Homininae TaxID=207598 RepID=H9KVD1_HUMAN|nr:forty-two-three domain containing 1 [Homo sapiens]KAI4033329.1 forty-two-three domain containing 1 [Homo sapiens]PNI24284.1 FYTTD1 isoform 5 [Pan troglodytes]
MNRFGTRLVGATATSSPPPKARSNENLDKIDMSLDDIIKLNRKEGKKQNFPRLNRRLLQQSGAQQFRMRVRWGIQQNSDTKTLESSIVKHMKRFVLVIPALWEVRARGLLKPRTSGPAWAT